MRGTGTLPSRRPVIASYQLTCRVRPERASRASLWAESEIASGSPSGSTRDTKAPPAAARTSIGARALVTGRPVSETPVARM